MKQRTASAVLRTCLTLTIAAAAAWSQGCYTRVVDAKGLGADSQELREAAEQDARPRRTIRRNLFPESDG